MGLIHILFFKFGASAPSDIVADICQRLVSLQEKCVSPNTGKPYIKSFKGGKDNSPEGKQGGFTHAFVCEFENDADRYYYLNRDPAHLAFVDSLSTAPPGLIEDLKVLDFAPGIF
ncbi:hypothetical protein L228DRAFT_285325 [Xylona heveae TC161]|uniref:Stress-response A/B barrel domain-containing protein n=1 Tax=Xylona heveae (strain CBS 132557 / TC161) TaxID=1328760 RepID=A0A165A4A1_XYLHT|nr:hypothetical protein L228DRAFT_285325 [Xylona heveae TC161]KZF19930.1 hypothetical protein L228DRAFT_285325 [Xylona heveae TC161]